MLLSQLESKEHIFETYFCVKYCCIWVIHIRGSCFQGLHWSCISSIMTSVFPAPCSNFNTSMHNMASCILSLCLKVEHYLLYRTGSYLEKMMWRISTGAFNYRTIFDIYSVWNTIHCITIIIHNDLIFLSFFPGKCTSTEFQLSVAIIVRSGLMF